MSASDRDVPVTATLIGYKQGSEGWCAVYRVLMKDGRTCWTTLLRDGYRSLYLDTPIEVERTDRPNEYPSTVTWQTRK